MEDAKPRPRRRHDGELKRQVLAECATPGASMARVAMAHGLNANLALCLTRHLAGAALAVIIRPATQAPRRHSPVGSNAGAARPILDPSSCSSPMNGHCLCGAVSFTSPDARDIGACHCGYCRRWGGGPMLAVHCGPGVEFTGAQNIAVYASSPWAERAFCKCCGTHLYYKLLATGEYFVPAGAFDSGDFELASQIYIDKKPGYYSFANQTPMLTEQQVVEQFAAEGGEGGA